MRQSKTFTFLFFIVLAIDIFAIATDSATLQTIAKPFLMPILLTYFFSATWAFKDQTKKWILLALIFSWAGDILLMFQGKNDIFFLLGLSAFLIAHIFYCLFFHHLKNQEKIVSRKATIIVVALYYLVLMFLLTPHLGDMKIPVRVYGIVISFMLLLALHMLYLNNKDAGRMMTAGAILFVVSDSVLAIDKFYRPFEMAGIIIMLTYGLAQWLITEGAIRNVKKEQNSQFLRT